MDRICHRIRKPTVFIPYMEISLRKSEPPDALGRTDTSNNPTTPGPSCQSGRSLHEYFTMVRFAHAETEARCAQTLSCQRLSDAFVSQGEAD